MSMDNIDAVCRVSFACPFRMCTLINRRAATVRAASALHAARATYM